MSWFAAGAFALTAVASISGGKGARDQAKAQEIAARTASEVEEIARKGRNEIRAAQVAFDSYQQSIRNKRIMERAGEDHAALGENLVRYMGQALKGSLSNQLQSAEAMGALSANAAAMGTGGSTTEMMKRTTSLQAAISDDELSRAADFAKYDAEKQRAAVLSNATDALDASLALAGIDNTAGSYHSAKVSGNAITDMLGITSTGANFGLLANAGAGGSGYKSDVTTVGRSQMYGGNAADVQSRSMPYRMPSKAEPSWRLK